MAQKLGAAFAKLAKKDIAEKMANTAKAWKESSTNDKLINLLGTISTLGVDLGPLLVPLNLILAQINQGTIEGMIELAETLNNLFQSPAVQGGLEIFTNIINGIVNTVSFLVDNLDNFLRALGVAVDETEDLTSSGAGTVEPTEPTTGIPRQDTGRGYSRW